MEEIKRVNEDPEFYEYMSAEEDNRKIESSIRTEFLKKGIKKEQVKIISTMLKQGLEIADISKYTGINKKEIEELLKK